MKPIEKQIVLVTGSTDGIGKITAQKLADMGATVLVHGRSEEKCAATVDEIRRNTENQTLKFYIADLSSLSAVRKLAQNISDNFDYLNVLINNAGIGLSKNLENRRVLSEDGYELSFAVNYLAPFLLTHLLIPLLRNGSPARIVNTSSAAQQEIDFDDLMLEHQYDAFRAYAQSKTALTMFTFEIAKRLEKGKITANCLHPGSLLDTKLVRESPYKPRAGAEAGAEVEIHVATSPELEGRTGLYFEEKRESRAHQQAYDTVARDKLWRLSEKLTGIREMSS